MEEGLTSEVSIRIYCDLKIFPSFPSIVLLPLRPTNYTTRKYLGTVTKTLTWAKKAQNTKPKKMIEKLEIFQCEFICFRSQNRNRERMAKRLSQIEAQPILLFEVSIFSQWNSVVVVVHLPQPVQRTLKLKLQKYISLFLFTTLLLFLLHR